MHYEAEVLPGLESFARAELATTFGDALQFHRNQPTDSLRFAYPGSLSNLLLLRTVVAIYRIEHFAVPRPRALLGHQHLQRITGRIDHIRGMHPSGSFLTFRISAAGSESAVFIRIKEAIESHTRMAYNPDDADLFIRIFPAPTEPGWEVLIRISPRPLSARGWRVCDMPGALNATAAAAMVALTEPSEDDVFYNPMCGSGTLMIERALAGPAIRIGGCDISKEALRCAAANLNGAGLAKHIELTKMDATGLDLPTDSVDVVCADLPWGQLAGSDDENLILYPAALAEWARVTRRGGRMVAITHAVRLFESLLDRLEREWQLSAEYRIFQGGLHPRIYAFRRK
nr:methyltransferase domain-containing protein [Anaerolineae bacterium]